MKNSLGKFLSLCILLSISSCSTCNDIDIVDIKKQMPTIAKVKDVIVKSNVFKSSNGLSKYEVKEITNQNDL